MKLYGYRNGRTLRALWALEEVGAEYDYIEVDLFRREGREPEFLRINPAGKVPVLDDDGTIITESAAICMHLAEKFPAIRLLPPPGTPERAACYKWISFILTELDAPLWTIAKHRFALPSERRVPAVIETATWECRNALNLLTSAIGGQAYIAAPYFTIADIITAHTLLWARSARIELAESLDRYLDASLFRDAAVRARGVAKDTVLAPASSDRG